MEKAMTPCRDCEKRQVGCHSSCEEYKAYAARLERIRAAKFEKNRETRDWCLTRFVRVKEAALQKKQSHQRKRV